jgi:SHO1 osmosensor
MWKARPQQDAPADYDQIVGFLAAGLVFTTSSVNALVYSPIASFEAAAAGYILLSMIAVSLPSAPSV